MTTNLNESINPNDYFYIDEDGDYRLTISNYEKMRKRHEKAIEDFKRVKGDAIHLFGEDYNQLRKLENKQKKELEKALQDDDFLREAIFHELLNCEYQYAPFCKIRPLYELGLTPDDYSSDERLKRIFDEAEDLMWGYVTETDSAFGCIE